MANGRYWMPLSQSRRIARTDAGVRGKGRRCVLNGAFGCSVPALLGLTCLNAILPTRLATADFSNGCGQASCEVSWKRWLEISGFKVGWMFARLSLMTVLLPPKKGIEGGQNETRQGNEDHGGRRPAWSSGGRVR